MDCFHLWVKNTARGICSVWGKLVRFFFNFSFESRQDVTFWVNVNNVPKIFSLEPFLQRLEKRLSFSLKKYAVRGKITGSGSMMECVQFFSLFCLEPHKTSLFEWMLTMSLKYSVLKTDRLIFLPKRCCVFYPQIETLRLSVCTLNTLSRTKVGTEYCFLELCIWEEIFDCEMHSHLEVLLWPSGTEENEILLCLKCTAPSCAVNTSNILFFSGSQNVMNERADVDYDLTWRKY